MLFAHIGFSLALIALVLSMGLILWSLRAEPGPGIVFAKVIGIIVFILAILQLACTIYSGVRYKADYKSGRHCCHLKNQNVESNAPNTPNQFMSPQSQPEGTDNLHPEAPTTPANP